MDHKTIIESVRKTNRLVILEEAWPFGNVSTEITYQVQSQAFDYLDAPIEKINTADPPAPAMITDIFFLSADFANIYILLGVL